MSELPAILIIGIITGLVYALSGAGLVVIYRSSKVINFAQGDLAAVGLFIAYGLSKSRNPYWIVAIVVIVTAALGGLVIGGLLGTKVARRWSILEVGLATIAASFLIEGLETQLYGGGAKAFPSVSSAVMFTAGGVQISVTDLVTVVVSLGVFGLLGLWFRYSKIGLAMRAVSEDPEAARWFGVSATRLRLVSWGIAGAFGGLAGLFIAPIYSLSPTSMGSVVLFGFASVVTGGFESILGAIVAGVLIGVITNITAAYVSVSLITPMMFLMMIAVLMLRPNGLLGERRAIRV